MYRLRGQCFRTTLVAVFCAAQTASSHSRAAAPGSDGPPQAGQIRAIAEFISDKHLEKVNSFLTLYRDTANGVLYLQIPANEGPDLLYKSILTSGFGSRDLGDDTLDRGKFSEDDLVAFCRFGPRVLLIKRNTFYYTPLSALGAPDDAGLSFPNSVVAGFDVKAAEGNDLLIDVTDFFRRDGIGIPSILKSAGQGSYTLDEKRSAVDVARAHTTPSSIEVDALLTFSTSDPPPERDILGRVAADRSAVLARERNALVQLPDPRTSSFRPRLFDPRSGFFDATFYDPTKLPNGRTRQSFILRYALSKKSTTEEVSDPERPIVFYIDPSVPQELHPLIAEAASWWNPAFEAAGFKDAVQVKELPPGMDPFDAGVNIILWVPRETRGFSYGGAINDPRTGEILKAIVRLDAMRLQADRLLFDALTTPYGDHPDFTARDAALKQRFLLLVAHEIGHTLGLRHQYIASAQGMSSVMDYPFPNMPLDANGVPLLQNAFPQGIGAWDKAAIFYGYHPFAPGEEAADLNALIEVNEQAGLYWMTDDDTGDADPLVEKWDRGTDPVTELGKVLDLRRAALERFSKYAIPSDEPLADLQDALAPLYLLHQFEVKAVASMLGGYTYRHSMRDGEPPVPVPASKQRRALQALLGTLDTETLWPGEHILALMSPRPPTYLASGESFSGDTGLIFDALRPVEDAASLTMNEILQPNRAARLAQAGVHDPGALTLDEVLAAVVAHTWEASPQQGSVGTAQRAIALIVLRSLLTSAGSKTSPMAVRGACWAALDELLGRMRAHPPVPDWKDTYAFATRAIAAAERDGGSFEVPRRRPPVLDPMGERD
jgi:Met-zincin/Domain of unknown function (DUF5117)